VGGNASEFFGVFIIVFGVPPLDVMLRTKERELVAPTYPKPELWIEDQIPVWIVKGDFLVALLFNFALYQVS
jgi:hypothetical protein